jgi:membrane-bound serine protease (ClpP class)
MKTGAPTRRFRVSIPLVVFNSTFQIPHSALANMDYLTIALILIGLGALLLLAEILIPTGGVLVVAALLCFAAAVGTILYYGTMMEAVVAVVGLAIAVPATGYVAVMAWRRMSLDSVLDEPQVAPVAPTSELDVLKGRTGKTVSPMRPSGTVDFDGKRVDAMTEGMMLDAGVWVRCVDVKRGQVIVRQIEEAVDVADINPSAKTQAATAEPKAETPASEQPQKEEPKKKDDFDDFDIGLENT